jgi:Sec-independent protein translocase protein TatA
MENTMHISFGEIFVILLVALLVIKPEHLPDIALKLGRFIKWVKQLFSIFKQELEEPLGKYSFLPSRDEDKK